MVEMTRKLFDAAMLAGLLLRGRKGDPLYVVEGEPWAVHALDCNDDTTVCSLADVECAVMDAFARLRCVSFNVNCNSGGDDPADWDGDLSTAGRYLFGGGGQRPRHWTRPMVLLAMCEALKAHNDAMEKEAANERS